MPINATLAPWYLMRNSKRQFQPPKLHTRRNSHTDARATSTCRSAHGTSLPPMHRHPRMHIEQILWPRHRPTTKHTPLSPFLTITSKLSTLRCDRTALSRTRRTSHPTASHLQHLHNVIFLPVSISRPLSLSLPRTAPLPDDAVDAEREDEDEERDGGVSQDDGPGL
jgi:hypothetical protein